RFARVPGERDAGAIPLREFPGGLLAAFFSVTRPPPRSTLFPYTTLFRSTRGSQPMRLGGRAVERCRGPVPPRPRAGQEQCARLRSEEHTSESSHVAISYAVFCLKKKTARR